MGVVAHTHAAQAVVSELVITLFFFRVGKDFVGLGAFLEFGFGFFFIVGVFVG